MGLLITNELKVGGHHLPKQEIWVLANMSHSPSYRYLDWRSANHGPLAMPICQYPAYGCLWSTTQT